MAGRLGRRNGGVMSGTVTAEREVMCGDMLAVMQGGMPRRWESAFSILA